MEKIPEWESAHEFPNGIDQFVNDFGFVVFERLHDARSDMAREKLFVECVKSGCRCGGDEKDIVAVGVIFDHFPDAADLAFDSGEACVQISAFFIGAHFFAMRAVAGMWACVYALIRRGVHAWIVYSQGVSVNASGGGEPPLAGGGSPDERAMGRDAKPCGKGAGYQAAHGDGAQRGGRARQRGGAS